MGDQVVNVVGSQTPYRRNDHMLLPNVAAAARIGKGDGGGV